MAGNLPKSLGIPPKSLGIQPKSFYSSSSNRTKSEFSRKLSIKRKLNSACEIVKSKRTQDYILSDKLYKTEPGKGGFLFSDADPPAIYRVFAKQSEALEFADRFTQFRVFASELNSDGKRNFLACHPQTFWRLLKAKSSDARHAYEVIGSGMHSKLYFDLEFREAEQKDYPTKIDGDLMLTKFKEFLKNDLCTVTFPELIDKIEMIDLDSSTDEKFSHHLIVNIFDHENDPVLFTDNLQVGNYVHQLICKMKQCPEFLLADNKVFVDDAVYTKNRNFRTFLSSKFGKHAILRKSQKDSNIGDREYFFKSLVTYVSSEEMERKKLIKFDVSSMSYKRHRMTKSVDNTTNILKRKQKTSTSSSSGVEISLNKSAFPEIDGHITNLVKSKGGYIRKVTPSLCGWYLTYDLANFRQCENIGRPHKSNNVKFVVDLKANKFCQTCHDSNCKDFSSNFWDLPDHCALPWQELFDDEIETKTTGENSAGNQENSNLWNSFANEKTREEEEEIDALLLEAEDESAMDQFLLQAVSQTEPENEQLASTNDDDDLFLLDAAQYLP